MLLVFDVKQRNLWSEYFPRRRAVRTHIVLYSLGRRMMPEPKLSKWIPKLSQWPWVSQSGPYPFPFQCQHKTWHMSESVRHGHVRAAKYTQRVFLLSKQATEKKQQRWWQSGLVKGASVTQLDFIRKVDRNQIQHIKELKQAVSLG